MTTMGKEQAKRKHADKTDAPAAKRAKENSGQPAPKHGKPAATKAAPKLLSKKEQRELVRSKKIKFKKNYATIHDTVLLWEQLRSKQTTKEQKQRLVSTILKKLQGNTVEVANHHSASRVIQWCLKEGSTADKDRLLGEVKANIVSLSRSKYGRHVVQKVISMSSKEEVPGLVKLFKGHVAEILRHPSGADVLDDLYSVCPQSCRNTLCAELYSREFSLFEGVGTHGESISHLSDLLAAVDGRKRQAVLDHLHKGLAPVLEKALLHPVMTHRLLRELLTEAPGSIVADVVDTLAATGGNALKLVHTHDGAAAAAMALAYGTPKDRKRLVKGMKGFVWQTADNEWGHAVVATALSVTDDTALTGKAILGELKPHLEEMCRSKHAHRVLMQLLAPDNHRYLPPAIYELLHPPHKTMMIAADTGPVDAGLDADDDEFIDAELQEEQQDAEDEDAMQQHGPEHGSGSEQAIESDSDAADADDLSEQGEEEANDASTHRADLQEQDDASPSPQVVERRLGESKKAADVRRRELLGSGKGSLAGALLQLCAAQAGELLRSQAGGDVVVEVVRGAAGGLLWQLDQAGVEQVHAVIVQEIAQAGSNIQPAGAGQQQLEGKTAKHNSQSDVENGADKKQQQEQDPLLTHYFGSRHLRRLLLAGGSKGADGAGARAFAERLWTGHLKAHSSQLLGSHAEKVLAAVLHCGVPAVVQEATAVLQPLVGPDVQAWANKFTGPVTGSTRNKKQQQSNTSLQKDQQKQPHSQQQEPCQPAPAPAGPPARKHQKHK